LHLLQHLADALDQVFSAHGPALKAVRDAQRGLPVTQADGRTAVSVPPRTPTPQAQTRAAQRRARRLATSVQVWTRHREGWSHRVIAQHLGRGRMTVVRSLQAPTVPERNGRSETRRSLLTPDQENLLTRWHAGCREARPRFRAIQRHGDPGSDPTVARDVQRLRQAQGLRPRGRRLGPTLPRVVAGRLTPLTTRRATRVVLKPPSPQTDDGTQRLACLTDQHRA